MSAKDLGITLSILDKEEWNILMFKNKSWYKHFIRAVVSDKTIYIKSDARFLFSHSYEDLILHEIGHILGFEHRWIGVMAWHGLFRL